MFEVQQNRWDQLIRRVSGSIGPGSRVSETLSELLPVMDVERVPGELLRLMGTDVAMASETMMEKGPGIGLYQGSDAMDLDPRDLTGFTLSLVYLHFNLIVRGV